MLRLAVLLCLLLPATASAAPRKVPQGWLGVVVDGPMTAPGFPQPEWDLLAGSGAESVRSAFYWRDIQPNGPADADFSRTDPVVLAAAQRGLSVLPVLQGTPAWAAQHPGDDASPPRDPADFARLLTALVTRYGPQGSLWGEHPELSRRPITDWQIWNEPNLTRYWNVAPWAPSYVTLLKAANAALKAADPTSRTILAGLPNESWLALREIYEQGGRGAFDVVALHPYTGRPANVVKLVRFARKEMRPRGDSRIPVWVTELSWPAALGKTNTTAGFETTEKGQAMRLATGLALLAREGRALRIGRVYWYTWLSAEGSSSSSFDYSGLRRLRAGRIVTAPSLAVFKRVARRLEGCSKRSGDAIHCR
jgi:polysaccharide biosynthesis protein PslG